MGKRTKGRFEEEAANFGAKFDPKRTPHGSEQDVPPQVVSHGSPVSDEEFKRMKEKAEREKVKRAIDPQSDDSANDLNDE